MFFYLANNVSVNAFNRCQFAIYGHALGQNLYIGYTRDVVKRWEEHKSDSANVHSPQYNTRFKVALRTNTSTVRHYILEVANSERKAKEKESAAIHFYRPSLNTGAPKYINGIRSRFQSICSQNCQKIFVKRQSLIAPQAAREEWERNRIKAMIVNNRNRKRVVSLENAHYSAGLFIECSRAERERFEIGEVVLVEVAESTKASGASYLVAKKICSFDKA